MDDMFLGDMLYLFIMMWFYMGVFMWYLKNFEPKKWFIVLFWLYIFFDKE
jgi:hypothetical protein